MVESRVSPEDLICYCGYYGGSCAIWCEYPHFRKLADLLAEWVDSMGCGYWMPGYIKDFDYNEFRKGLEYFGREKDGLICTKCCKGGEGNPFCKIRECCKEKELEVCFDCDVFPCEKTAPHSHGSAGRLGYHQVVYCRQCGGYPVRPADGIEHGMDHREQGG